MEAKKYILFLGNFDPLSKLVSAVLTKESSLRLIILDEHTLNRVKPILCVSSAKNIVMELDEKQLHFQDISGILVNHFSIDPINGDKNAEERYWSEWSAFLGGLLTEHKNVLNPPSMGSWCGYFPTISKQIEIVTTCMESSLIIPDLIALIEYLHREDDVDKIPQEGYGYCVPYTFWSQVLNHTNLTDTAVEYGCCFIDNEYIFRGCGDATARRILKEIVSLYRSVTKTRIGEICIFLNDANYYFRYAISRPQIRNFDWNSKLRIAEGIADRLRNCGDQ